MHDNFHTPPVVQHEQAKAMQMQTTHNGRVHVHPRFRTRFKQSLTDMCMWNANAMGQTCTSPAPHSQARTSSHAHSTTHAHTQTMRSFDANDRQETIFTPHAHTHTYTCVATRTLTVCARPSGLHVATCFCVMKRTGHASCTGVALEQCAHIPSAHTPQSRHTCMHATDNRPYIHTH
jgi:hypothetical protein